MKPGQSYVSPRGDHFAVVECVGVAENDIPLANVKAGEPLMITWETVYVSYDSAKRAAEANRLVVVGYPGGKVE